MANVAMPRETGSLLVKNALESGWDRPPGIGATIVKPGAPSIQDQLAGIRPPGIGATIPGTTVPNSGTPSVAPSMLPQYKDPLAGWDPAAISRMIGGPDTMQYQSGGDFVPGSIDTSGDAGFEALLRERMAGGGMIGLDQMMSDVLNPYMAVANREAVRDMDMATEYMISRGMLDSSEAGRAIADIGIELYEKKMAKMGELGWQFEQVKQENINAALSQFGIQEGNKLQATTTITATNISAAAQVKSSLIGAGATRDAAMISAQARLQEAGLNASVALESLQRQMDMRLVEQGIDPVAFANDPEYRGGVFEYFEALRYEELALIQGINDGQLDEVYAGPRPS